MRYTHGMWGTRFYSIWMNIISRSNGHNKGYKYKIKNEWNSFEHFKKDMYKSYILHVKKYGEKQTSIDRRNNKGNYSKENCRWVTKKKQSRNTQSNVYIIYKGKKRTIAEWSENLAINYSTLRDRIFKYHWPIDLAMSASTSKKKLVKYLREGKRFSN